MLSFRLQEFQSTLAVECLESFLIRRKGFGLCFWQEIFEVQIHVLFLLQNPVFYCLGGSGFVVQQFTQNKFHFTVID